MGRKGVSKRKPKKSGPISNTNISGSSNGRSGERSPVQSMVKDQSASVNRNNTNPSAGSNKTQKKR